MKQVSEILELALRRLPCAKKIKEQIVLDSWPEVTGDKIARKTKPLFIKDGIMFIAVQDSVWAQHLSLQKNYIIPRLNRKARTRLLKDLRFQSEGTNLEYHEDVVIKEKSDWRKEELAAEDMVVVENALLEGSPPPEFYQSLKSMLILQKKYLRWLFENGCKPCIHCSMPVFPIDHGDECHCCKIGKNI